MLGKRQADGRAGLPAPLAGGPPPSQAPLLDASAPPARSGACSQEVCRLQRGLQLSCGCPNSQRCRPSAELRAEADEIDRISLLAVSS